MSSGCGDVLSLADLQTAKKHQIFEAEVITGKSGGVAGGADIDYATNQVTGQTQKTLPAVLRDAGFSPVSWDFSIGGTLTVNDRDKVVYDPVSETWYSYAGTLPVTVPAGFNPVGNADWKPQTDPNLRGELFSESGFSLVGATNYAGIRAHNGSADKFYCYGKTSVSDGGEGWFFLDTTDVSTADDGGTVLVSASGGRYKRQSDGVAMLEWWEGANINDPDSDCLSAWNKFANSDVYSKLKLRTGTYRFSDSLTTVAGKQKDIEGQGFWKTILQVAGTGYGLQAFETLTGRRFQIRRVNGSGIVEEPGFGIGVGSGFRAANNLSSSAYTRLEQVLVLGHFNIGFEINAVSGTYVNCNAYNTKGDGYNVSGGSNHFEKCWAEHNSSRAFTITGIGNQLFQCYEEQNNLTNPELSQVFIGPVSGIGSGMDTRIEDFNYNPRNSQLNVPVFDCNASSIYISAIEEVAVDGNKLVCSFSQYCTNSHYDGKGLVSGGVIGGRPASYNRNKATVKGVANAGGGLLPSDKGISVATQLISFSALNQVFSGAPGTMSLGANNASLRESATAWNLAFPGSNINIYSLRLNVLTAGAKVAVRFFNQGFESTDLLVTSGLVQSFTLKGTGLAPFASGATSTDTLFGLKLINQADSVANAVVGVEIEYSYS